MIFYKPIRTKDELDEIKDIVLTQKEEVIINSPLTRTTLLKSNINMEKALKAKELLLKKRTRKIYNILYSIYAHINSYTQNNSRTPWISFIKDEDKAFKIANLKEKELVFKVLESVNRIENRNSNYYQTTFATKKYNQGIYLVDIDETKIITDLSLMTDKELLSKLDKGYLIDLGTKENFEYLKSIIISKSTASDELMEAMKNNLIKGLIAAYNSNELIAYNKFILPYSKFKYINNKSLLSIEVLEKAKKELEREIKKQIKKKI